MTVFIVCHKDLPSYPPPEGAKIIWLNSKPPLENKGMDVIAGYDFFSEPEEIHAKLSGSLGTLVIAKVVSEETVKPRNITIWQYRKFLTRLNIGTPNPEYPGMAVAVRDAALASNWSSQLPRRGALISVSSADCANAGAAIALAPTVAADARKARRERTSIPFFFDIRPNHQCRDEKSRGSLRYHCALTQIPIRSFSRRIGKVRLSHHKIAMRSLNTPDRSIESAGC